MLANCSGVVLKDCIKVQEKKKKVVVLCSRPRQDVKFRHFHVVIVQRRQRNVQKSLMHLQICCFANLNQLLLCRSRCRHRRHCLTLITPTPPTKHRVKKKSALNVDSAVSTMAASASFFIATSCL